MIKIPSKTKPRAYQQKLYEQFADRKRLMFAVGMSGGKCKLTIDMHNYHAFKKSIVVCPNKVKDVWPVEFYKHSHQLYQVFVFEGNSKQKETILANFLKCGTYATLVISYDSIWRSPYIEILLKNINSIDAMVLDESHNIKRSGANRSKAVCMLGRNIEYKYCLTGTAMSESYTDIFGQFKFLDRSIFGESMTKFKARYCIMGGYGNYEIKGYKNTDELTEKLKPYWAFIPQEEINQDLPPITNLRRFTDLSAGVKRIYTELLKEGILQKENKDVVVTKNILDRYIRLRELISGHLTWKKENNETYQECIHKEKELLLEEVINEIDVKEPLVIFTTSKSNLQKIKAICLANGRDVSELSGQANELENWKAGETNTLVLNIQAGNAGISLTRACYNIYYDLPYSLTQYLQSEKRTHRSGQLKPVVNIHLLIRNTIDEDIYQALQDKQDIVETIKRKLEKQA